MNQPQFSFVVSSYNYAGYLPECLNSLIQQDYLKDHFEIIVIDDGSSDKSVDCIRQFASQDSRIRVFQTRNIGIEKVCNLGIREARFPFIVRVDADDFVDTNLLSLMAQAILAQPGFSFYYLKEYVIYFSPEEQIAKSLPDFDPQEIFCRGDFLASGTVYRKEVLTEIGSYPEGVKNCGLENYALILALISKGHRGLAVGGTRFYYRRHKTNVSRVKLESIIHFGQTLLANYDRPYQTNEFHPYELKLGNHSTIS